MSSLTTGRLPDGRAPKVRVEVGLEEARRDFRAVLERICGLTENGLGEGERGLTDEGGQMGGWAFSTV